MSVSCHGVRRGRSWPHVNEGVDDGGQRRERRAVALVEGIVAVPGPEAEERLVPSRRASDDARVGIHQDLVRIEAMPVVGIVRTVHAVAVQLAGAHVRQIAMPAHVGLLGERDRHRL